MKPIFIKWNDSNCVHGWRLKDEVNDDVAHCNTVGFLIADLEDKVILAMGESDCGSVMTTLTIPRGCIISVNELIPS